MIKRRNHYIPRVLLRRFAFRETAKGQAYLWQLAKDGRVVQLETKNAGVESFFYGDPSTGIEDGLARVETEWSRLLGQLDQAGCVNNLPSDLWRFAWLLGIRTRAVREHWSGTARALLASMAATETKTMVDGLNREFDRTIEQNWESVLSQLPGDKRDAVRNAVEADPALKARLLEQVRAQVAKTMPDLFRVVLGSVASKAVAGGAGQGQIKGLSKLLSTDVAPVDALAPESWTVLSFPPQSVVLGDGVTFTVGPKGQVGSVGRFKEDLEAVYVPISHERVLVGCRRGTVPLDVEAINAASACLSSDVIFAARNSEIEQDLAARVGSVEPMLSDVERSEVLDDVWRDFGRK
jgi:hypothetical protein